MSTGRTVSAKEAAKRGGSRQWPEALYRWLSAPLLITIVGALLINFVIPQITAKSEDHKRSLEIKTGLVGEISRSLTDAVISARFVAGDVIRLESNVKQQQRFYNEGLRAWETKRGQLQSQIDAYFAGSFVARDWRTLATAVSDLYTLSASGVPDRTNRMRRIRDYLVAQHYVRVPGLIDWDALVTKRPRTEKRATDNHFRAVYKAVGNLVLRRGDAFVDDILGSDVSGL